MKFKVGDRLVKKTDKNMVWYQSLYNCKEIKITDIVQIDQTFYYKINTIPKLNTNPKNYIYPQFNMDDMYDLDIIQDRINKITKIKNGISKR